jgi:uncharacterized delta-60 repeat protein
MNKGGRGFRVLMGLLGCVGMALLLAPAVAVAGPLRGVLDRSFGGDGRVLSNLGDTRVSSRFTSMVRQSDGKLVLTASVGAFGHIVERRQPNGPLDAGFGDGGVVKVPKARETMGLALLGDGRILVGVVYEGDPCGRSTIRRLLPTGAPDRSFGSDGVSATVPFAVSHLTVDATGRILVAGQFRDGPCGKSPPPAHPAVVRLGADGGLDRGFGAEGVAHFDAEGEEGSSATGLAVREDGTILVMGHRRLLALSADGALDPSFGTGGVVGPVGSPNALLALPGGGALVAGSSSDSSLTPGDFLLSRYRPDGSLDPSFGSGGTARLDVGEVDATGALALGPDRSIVLAGGTSAAACPASDCPVTPILARFTAGGALDPDFGTSGWTSVEIPTEDTGYGYEPYLAALAIAPDGSVVAAGGAGYSDAFVIARDGSGRPDPSFGSAGAVTEVRTRPSETSVTGLAVARSGEILVSAWSNVGQHRRRGVLLASKPSGGFDPTLGSGGPVAEDKTGGVLWTGRENHAYSLTSTKVTRFGSHGRPDRNYGSEGVARLPASFRAIALDVRRGGGAVAVGRIANRRAMAAFGLTPRGLPDRGFGRDGLALVGFGGTKATEARNIAIDGRGRAVLVGRSGGEAIAARLLPDGRLDRAFARGGRLRGLPISGLAEVGITPQGGGILIGGREAGRGKPVLLLRVGGDGARDRSFGRDGTLRIEARGPSLSLFASRRQIVFVSARSPGGAGGVVLRAYEPDGTVDREFGRHGVVAASGRSTRYFRPVAAVRQPSGRIVVAATSAPLAGGAGVELLRFR